MKKKLPKDFKPAFEGLFWKALPILVWMGVVIFFFLKENPVFRMMSSPSHSSPASGGLFPFSYILFCLKVLFFNISMTMGIWGLGHWALKKMPISWDSSIEQFVFETALGFGITSLVMFLFGTLSLYQTWVFWTFFTASGLLAIGTVFVTPDGKVYFGNLKNDFKALLSTASKNPFQSLILLITIGVGLMMSFVPEIFYDPLVYHMGVPNWFLHAKKIVNIPILYSHYTLSWQMVNLYALGLTNTDAVAKFFHLFSGVLLSLGFFSLMKRWEVPPGGILAAVLFLTMPMAQLALWTTGNDISVSLFAFLSTYGLLALVKKKSETEILWPWIFLCGIFAGFSLTTKYTSAIHLPAILGGVFVYSFLTKQFRLAVRFTWVYGIIIGVLFLPWAIKNAIFTGNPFYHFFTGIFDGEGGHPVKLLAIQLNQLGVVPQQWWQYLTLPWVLTMKDNSSLSYPGPFLLAALPLVFAIPKTIRREPWFVALVVYISFEAFILLPMARTLRYHLPNMTALFVLLSLGWVWFHKRTNWFGRSVLILATNLCLVIQIVGSWNSLRYSYSPWNVLTGREPRETYREYTHPGLNPYPSDAAYVWLEENIPNAKVLIFGDEKNFPCPVTYYASGVFDYNLLARLADRARTPEDILQELQKMEITHILFNFGEARRLWGYLGVLEWNPKNLGLIGKFWEKYVRMVREITVDEVLFPGAKSSLMIYEIIDKQSPRFSERPSFNPIIYLYEDYFAQRRKWGASQRANFIQKLLQKWPDVLAFRYRLMELGAHPGPQR